MSNKDNRERQLKAARRGMFRHAEISSKTRKKHAQVFAASLSSVEVNEEKLDKKQIEENLKNFKTADGKHFTGMKYVEKPIIDVYDDSTKISDYPESLMLFNAKLKQMFKQAVEGRTYPNVCNYTNACKGNTNQSIGTCYMHSSINWIKWFLWMHTGVAYQPDNHTIDYVYAGGNLTGGYEDDATRLWSLDDSGDNFLKAAKRELTACGITKSTMGSCPRYRAVGEEGKNNVIKLLNVHGPIYFVHDCGLFSSGGYHAVLIIGYDSKNIYIWNSWGNTPGDIDVTWSRFMSFDHPLAGSRGVYMTSYGLPSGCNVWKNL